MDYLIWLEIWEITIILVIVPHITEETYYQKFKAIANHYCHQYHYWPHCI